MHGNDLSGCVPLRHGVASHLTRPFFTGYIGRSAYKRIAINYLFWSVPKHDGLQYLNVARNVHELCKLFIVIWMGVILHEYIIYRATICMNTLYYSTCTVINCPINGYHSQHWQHLTELEVCCCFGCGTVNFTHAATFTTYQTKGLYFNNIIMLEWFLDQAIILL